MFAFYNRLLSKHPILTKMVTSGTLFSLGDYITQTGTSYVIQSSTRKAPLTGPETEICLS